MDTGILSIGLLAVWGLIHFILKSIFDYTMYVKDPKGDVIYDENNNKKVYLYKETIQLFLFILFIVVLIVFQVMATLYGYQEYANSVTGMDNVNISSKYPALILSTIIPWTLMFGMLIALLKIFPGWKQPFANTLGYLLVKILGIQKILNSLLITYSDTGVSEDVDTEDENFNRAIRTIKPILNDSTLIINEVSSETFQNFWNTMENGKLIKDRQTYKTTNDGKNRDDAQNSLEQYIAIKDNFAEYIWYLLAGTYIASYVQTLVTSIDPPVSTDQLNDQYNNKVEEGQQINDEDQRTYLQEE